MIENSKIDKIFNKQSKCQFNIKNTLLNVLDTQFMQLNLQNMKLSFEKQFPTNLYGKVNIFQRFLFLINDFIFNHCSQLHNASNKESQFFRIRQSMNSFNTINNNSMTMTRNNNNIYSSQMNNPKTPKTMNNLEVMCSINDYMRGKYSILIKYKCKLEARLQSFSEILEWFLSNESSVNDISYSQIDDSDRYLKILQMLKKKLKFQLSQKIENNEYYFTIQIPFYSNEFIDKQQTYYNPKTVSLFFLKQSKNENTYQWNRKSQTQIIPINLKPINQTQKRDLVNSSVNRRSGENIRNNITHSNGIQEDSRTYNSIKNGSKNEDCNTKSIDNKLGSNNKEESYKSRMENKINQQQKILDGQLQMMNHQMSNQNSLSIKSRQNHNAQIQSVFVQKRQLNYDIESSEKKQLSDRALYVNKICSKIQKKHSNIKSQRDVFIGMEQSFKKKEYKKKQEQNKIQVMQILQKQEEDLKKQLRQQEIGFKQQIVQKKKVLKKHFKSYLDDMARRCQTSHHQLGGGVDLANSKQKEQYSLDRSCKFNSLQNIELSKKSNKQFDKIDIMNSVQRIVRNDKQEQNLNQKESYKQTKDLIKKMKIFRQNGSQMSLESKESQADEVELNREIWKKYMEIFQTHLKKYSQLKDKVQQPDVYMMKTIIRLLLNYFKSQFKYLVQAVDFVNSQQNVQLLQDIVQQIQQKKDPKIKSQISCKQLIKNCMQYSDNKISEKEQSLSQSYSHNMKLQKMDSPIISTHMQQINLDVKSLTGNTIYSRQDQTENYEETNQQVIMYYEKFKLKNSYLKCWNNVNENKNNIVSSLVIHKNCKDNHIVNRSQSVSSK